MKKAREKFVRNIQPPDCTLKWWAISARFSVKIKYFYSPGPLWIPASLLNGLPLLKVTYLLTPAQLNEMLYDFALSVRAKDGNDYEG